MLSLNEARRVIRAAEEKARELGCAVNIAVVDESGHVTAQVRMDGAWLAGIDAAVSKAYTARSFDSATSDLTAFTRSGEFGDLNQGFGRRMLLAAGGVLLRRNGRICGAIGVSGAASSEDETIARAAARVLTGSYASGHLTGYRNAESEDRGISASQIARLGQRTISSQTQYHPPIQ